MSRDLKTKIARVLFLLALILLISDLLIGKFYPGRETSAEHLTGKEADTILVKTLESFGMEKEWLGKEGNKYTILLPADLPSELIMLDMEENFSGKDAEIRSREIRKGVRSEMEVISGGDVILTAVFSYDKTRTRKSFPLSIMITGSEELDANDFSDLIRLPERFSAALIPSKLNRGRADSLISWGKEYCVLLNNSINELDYSLDNKFSDKKIRITIHTIVENFPHAVCFIIDNRSGYYSHRVNGLVRSGLAKRKIAYYPLSRFKLVEDVPLTFDPEKFIEGLKENVAVIDAPEYLRISRDLMKLRKKGYRFTGLSAQSM